MPFTVTMPKLSPTMEEGVIAKWHAKEGDFVKSGDVLFEVATDKATVEHSALDEGWLKKILVHEGESAILNQPVAVLTASQEESIEGYTPEGVMSQSKEAPKEEAEAPEAAPPAPEKEAGAPFKQPRFAPEPPLASYIFPTREGEGRVLASPLAKKLAREQKLDLTSIKGTGPHGRVVSRDLALAKPLPAAVAGKPEAPELPPGSYEEEALSPMRKVIAERLQQAKTFIPHFYCTQEVRADRLMAMREELAAGELKLSVNDFVLRATALALREHPALNSGFNSVSGKIVRFKTIDISVAVSLESGLITPILRHADYKSILQLSREIKALAGRAREGKLAREEYFGGSFSVSNLGMYGITEFKAIINPPQGAILAVAGIEEKPVVREGHVRVGKTMQLTLAADHRVMDGTDVAKFLKTLQKFLEHPSLLLL